MESNQLANSIEGFAQLSRKAAAQGCVLLKNEHNVLPLKKEESIAVFGRVQIDSYRSGTGSGGSVNVPYKTTILGGLQSKGILLNEEVVQAYKQWIVENPFDNGGGGWAQEPWHQKEMILSEELVKKASEVSHKAVVIIGRTAGEDQDNAATEGSYLLTQEEYDMVRQVARYFEQVIVVLNVSNIIDMSWVEEEGIASAIKSILYVWQGGMEVGNAVADVLVGDVTPSGKLTDTIAFDITDYPSTQNYGNEFRNDYQEDIYVGYRYFETFCPDKVQYAFGYGLSYTNFSMVCHSASLNGDLFEIAVKVQNIGAQYTGREVVQIYVEAPQGKLGKPKRELVGFAKTSDLAPGQEEMVVLAIPMKRLASYDDSGITGAPYSYVLEAGTYQLFVGNSISNLEAIPVNTQNGWYTEELVVVEKLQQALAPRVALTRLKPGTQKADGTYEKCYEEAPKQKVCLRERVEAFLPPHIPQTGNQGYTLRDVHEGKVTMERFIGQLSIEDLAAIVRGEGMGSPLVTEGTASAFGGVTQELRRYGIPLVCTADGPSGIRMEGGGHATQLPIGTALAATWDVELIEALYVLEGKEMLLNEVDVLLGPGMNIRRSPLNGRNFEYFSEDPLVTGEMAAAVIKGIAKVGTHGTLKHFACNNQEQYRNSVDAVVSERCLREIYLKGFEIAVKEGEAQSIMTAYNPVNSFWTASNYDLTTTILRKEWGFEGIVMTDWWAKMNDIFEGGQATIENTANMVKAQNDLYMVVPNFGAAVNVSNDNTVEALEKNRLRIEELQQCAMNICRFILKTPVFAKGRMVGEVFKSIGAKEQTIPVEYVDTIKALEVEPSYDDNQYVTVPEKGTYDLFAVLSSPHTNLTQIVCGLMINDEVVTNIQAQGTKGKCVTDKIMRVQLEEGIYKLRLKKIKPEITIHSILLEKVEA